jgi:hypothetical protein
MVAILPLRIGNDKRACRNLRAESQIVGQPEVTLKNQCSPKQTSGYAVIQAFSPGSALNAKSSSPGIKRIV